MSSPAPEDPSLLTLPGPGSPPAEAAPGAGPEASGQLPLAADGFARLAGGRPLKVLQVTHDLVPGGLQRVVIDLADGLRRLGHEAHICSLRGDGPLAAEIRDRGIPLRIMPWPGKGADRLLFLKLRRLMAREAYEVAHTHNTHAFLDGGLAALLAGVPCRIHTDHARSFPDKLRYMVLERLMSRGYHKVVGVSDHTAANLARYEGIRAGKLAVIRNGIDGAWYRAERDRLDRAALREAAGLGGFSRVIGLGVRLEEQKGIVHLLEAMPEVLRRHPGTALAVAGAGSLEGPLRDRAAALGLGRNVRFLGGMPQLTAFYPLLDAYVLPSLWEGLPLCLLEAMSLSLPIVATAVGGVPALLADGRSARLVPPADPAALAEAVSAVLGDPAAAEAMGREARRDFDERYDSMVMVRAYLGLYRSALGEAGSP